MADSSAPIQPKSGTKDANEMAALGFPRWAKKYSQSLSKHRRTVSKRKIHDTNRQSIPESGSPPSSVSHYLSCSAKRYPQEQQFATKTSNNNRPEHDSASFKRFYELSTVSPVAAALNFSQVKRPPSAAVVEESRLEAAVSQIFEQIEYNIDDYMPKQSNLKASFFEQKQQAKFTIQSHQSPKQKESKSFGIRIIPTEHGTSAQLAQERPSSRQSDQKDSKGTMQLDTQSLSQNDRQRLAKLVLEGQKVQMPAIAVPKQAATITVEEVDQPSTSSFANQSREKKPQRKAFTEGIVLIQRTFRDFLQKKAQSGLQKPLTQNYFQALTEESSDSDVDETDLQWQCKGLQVDQENIEQAIQQLLE